MRTDLSACVESGWAGVWLRESLTQKKDRDKICIEKREKNEKEQ